MSKIFNNALFEAKERESAVSPVVGVMLMLVVTIIIAATVSAFAGGLVGTADKAPQAAFDVKVAVTHHLGYYPYDDRVLTITHLGGDPIDTARTKLVTSWTNRTTKEIYYSETTALPLGTTPEVFNTATGQTTNLTLTDANVNYTSEWDPYPTYKYQEPYFVIPNIMPDVDENLWFGNFILHSGEIMKVQSSTASYNTDGEAYSVIKNAKYLTSKDVINIKLVDIPTGNIIYNKDIYVTESSLNDA
jgi:FlaG/FlaF family flagellin (archaellin)